MGKTIIIDEEAGQNWETYQPEVILSQMEKYVQIKFLKKGADAISIYKRIGKNAEWRFAATVTDSPFDDFDVEAGEKMEYRFCGIKDKNEIGMSLIMAIDDLPLREQEL